MALSVVCPAKVNVFLSIGGPDATGYHPLRSVFQTVSLADELHLEVGQEDAFVCDCDEVPIENTVTKAWRLSREYNDIPRLRVTLKKRIPARSGLGGGSSDAAGFLRGLTHLLKGRFTQDEAREVATAVGADVPFFLIGGTARATGYGEVLTPLPDGDPCHLLIVMPQASSVSTPEAYAALDRVPRPFLDFPDTVWSQHNDFELVAPAACLEAIEWMRRRGSQLCGLTGSGAAVFGVFDSNADAHDAAGAWSCEMLGSFWVCHTLNRKESLWMS